MCGICGAYNAAGIQPADQAIVHSMMDALSHRGPDGEGFWASKEVVLGHRRLAIIDLAGGYQPQFNETKDIGVICNGEIYNYRELRRELSANGHEFRTSSDTEVLVHAYEQWGDSFVSRLRGMFAIAMWDSRKRRFLLVRDRYGVKPLYYAKPEPGTWLFASEIKALFADRRLTRRINESRVGEYLSFRTVAGEETLFAGVFEVLPGTMMILEGLRSSVVTYWTPEASADHSVGTDYVNEGRKLLYDAVDSRLVSDVALGTITSGGLDSSLVSAITAEIQKQPIDTFCVGFSNPRYDERPFARSVADAIRSNHHELAISPDDIEEQLDTLTWAHDEPLTHPNSIPMHQIFRHAKEDCDVTVLLSGEGADEVFGGYGRYGVLKTRNLIKSVPGAAKMAGLMPTVGKVATLKKILDPDYLIWSNSFTNAATVQKLSGAEIVNHVWDRRKFLPTPGRNGNGMFIYDQRTYLPALLQRQDRMIMAAGLEAREPFLDHLLVQWANALSPSAKLYHGETKGLLKQIAGKWLSQEIITRKKVGFEVPLRVWLRPGGILYARVQAIREKGSIVQDITAANAVEELIKQHENEEHDHSDTLWTLLALDTWARTFLGSELRTERLPGADTGKELPKPQDIARRAHDE